MKRTIFLLKVLMTAVIKEIMTHIASVHMFNFFSTAFCYNDGKL